MPLLGCAVLMQSPDLAVLDGLLHNPALEQGGTPAIIGVWSTLGHGLHFPAALDSWGMHSQCPSQQLLCLTCLTCGFILEGVV